MSFERIIHFNIYSTDWVLNLVVVDDSLQGRSDFDSPHPAGLTVAIFKKSPEDFPAVKDIGDIVQFRHFKVACTINIQIN